MDVKVKDIIGDNSIWLPSKDYNNSSPKLSILMPTYGKSKGNFFKKAVTSYIEQTFKNTELIIIDDANTDGTSEQIDRFMEQDARISCIRHKKNRGLPVISTYEALKVARGKYIGFLFDNCVLYPSAYERSLKKMEKENAEVSYGRVLLSSDVNDAKATTVYYDEKNLDNLESNDFIRHISIIFKRDILETVGYLDPHVSLMDANGWDFITRIKRKLYLIETGVLFAKEYKKNRKLSNGNEYLLNSSIVNEYFKQPDREKKLLLDKYEEINIFSREENSSYNFIIELEKLYDSFKDKYWISSSKENNEKRDFFKDNIIVHCNNFISASSTLIFNRNSNAQSQSMFSYVCTDKNIAKARAVILVRETDMNSSLLKKLEYAKIPVYLLWDDDFLVLAKEKAFNLNITENSFRKAAKQFYGLIFTSNHFYKTYKEKKYNKNNYLLNPIYLDGLEKKISTIEKNQLKIAFTGGAWRINDFKEMLIEILNNIKKDMDVILYLPKNKNLENFFYENKVEFSTIWYEITLSYDQLINKLGNENIHILIHPAKYSSNNVNKTKNALVTASLLGAALITTDEAPYNVKDSENDPMPYLLASNQAKYWTEAIKELLDDERRTDMVKVARDYCKERYSAKCLDELIQAIFKNTFKVDFEVYSERLERLAHFSGKMNIKATSNHVVDGAEEDIIATKKINKSLKAYFIADKEEFSTIKMIFGTHNKVIHGTCDIQIYDNENNQIHQDTISLEQITDNVFYNFYTGHIENAMGKKFYISFNFHYKNSTDKISIYEENYKYSNNRIVRNLIRPFRTNKIYTVLA